MGKGLTFASVVGRPIGASRTPIAVIAMQSMERMNARESELRRANFVRLTTGLLIIVGVLGLGVWGLLGFIAHILAGADHPIPPIRIAIFFSLVTLLPTFLIAAFTRKESRSDAADQVLESGSRSTGGDDNPLVRLYLVIIMLGLLYGEFLVIDAIKATWIRTRLRGVDRRRCAVILGTVLSQPIDIETRTLLRVGETPMQLRQLLAYLIAYEWVDISVDGLYLRLLSPARRALRE